MKRSGWAVSVILVIIGAAATGIGWEAGMTSAGLWAQIAAGFTAGTGIAVLAVVITDVTRKSRAR
jgi:hypothetical protein